MATATQDRDVQKPGRVQPTPKGRIGVIVAESLAIGLLAALALVAAPFVPAKENVLTGVALLGFAFGWALLAVRSARSSDQPQRCAVAPAVLMALAGLVSLIGPTPYGMCSAGCGRQYCSGSLSGCSFGPAGSCAAESDAGCCIRSWLC